MHSPGVMERRGIHVEDIASAVQLALVTDTGTYDVVNLTCDTPRLDTAPNDKAKRLLGWEPKHDFEFRPELEDWSQPNDPPPDALPRAPRLTRIFEDATVRRHVDVGGARGRF